MLKSIEMKSFLASLPGDVMLVNSNPFNKHVFFSQQIAAQKS